MAALEDNNFSVHFQIVVETCGIETARILNKELGRITVSIPILMSLRSLFERYIQEKVDEIPIKRIARELGMSERAISNILKKIKNI